MRPAPEGFPTTPTQKQIDQRRAALKFDAGCLDARAGWRPKTDDVDYMRGYALGCCLI